MRCSRSPAATCRTRPACTSRSTPAWPPPSCDDDPAMTTMPGGTVGPREVTVAAVDLGASSGRVMVGRLGRGTVELVEVHRFPNEPVRVRDTLHWDILALHRGVLRGLRAAGEVTSI